MRNGGMTFLLLGVALLFPALAAIVLMGMKLLPGFFIPAAAILAAVGTGFAAGGCMLLIRKRREERIRSGGIPARAIIKKWWIAARDATEMASVESIILELEISAGGKPTYTIRHRQLLPYSFYSQFQEGAAIPVKIDPLDPRRIIIET